MNWKRIGLSTFFLLVVLATATVASARGGLPPELEAVRSATARYQNVANAQADGYEPFLDCFDNPGVGGMGYHYVDFSIVDLELDPLRPEAMVYQTWKDGKLRLGAVEYIVPAADWDAAGNSTPPMLLGQHFHLNTQLQVYVLHAWAWQKNPAGVYMDWNPNVSCN